MLSAAARMKQVSTSCAAMIQKSSPDLEPWRICCTKWSASRNASSMLSMAARGFHHQLCGSWVMAWGSNTHTGPFVARWAEVAAHRSGLLLVASTEPGAAMTAGTARAVVLPARGAMTARTTSSQDAYRVGPRPRRRRYAPNAIPASGGAMSRTGRSARDGRSRRARSATPGSVIVATSRGSASDGSGSSGCGRWRCQSSQPVTASAPQASTSAR